MSAYLDMVSVSPAVLKAAPTVSALAPSGRLLRPLSGKFVETLHKLDLPELEALEAILAASPHNRQLSTGGDLLNLALAQLPRIEDAERRAAMLRIIRHMGSHRFTVHNTRYLLASVALSEAAHASGGFAGASAGSAALELLQLMGDVLGASTGPDLPAYWDMGVGVMGATGFDLPADRLVLLASKGAFAISCWLRLDALNTQPIAVFGVTDAVGAGVQLQLSRAGAGLARAELLVTEPQRSANPGSKLLARLPGAAARQSAAALGGNVSFETSIVIFEGDMVVRCGAWHLLTLSCRRGALLGFGSAGRDEALLCVDGSRAARANGFRYPAWVTEQSSQGRAAVGAPAATRSPAAALRGQLGPFMLFQSALSVAELEACFDAARVGRTLFEWPQVMAGWHPLLTDASTREFAGTCIAATAEGPWAARARSEAISVIEVVHAKDSAGGMLNLLLPLLALRRKGYPYGDSVLAATLRLLSRLLCGHLRNQIELLRSDGMTLLGHLVSTIRPAHVGEATISALAGLASTCRELPDLYKEFLQRVLLRMDAWRRLDTVVLGSLLALLNGLSSADEGATHAVALPQRMLDAARRYFVRPVTLPHGRLRAMQPASPVVFRETVDSVSEEMAVHRLLGTMLGADINTPAKAAAARTQGREVVVTPEAVHAQCLSTAALLGSDRLACQGALPLLAHALHFGYRPSGAELEAQVTTLLLRLSEADCHG